MKSGKNDFSNIDEYIKLFPKEVRAKLTALRKTIRSSAPGALERISYQMPAFWFEGNLVYFAGYANHIGFYPAPRGIEAFKKELSKYKGGKGTVQFPLDQPLPLGLISKIVKFRVAENRAKAAEKSKKKKPAARE